MRWHVVGVLLLGLLLPLPLLWVMGLLPSVGSRPPAHLDSVTIVPRLSPEQLSGLPTWRRSCSVDEDCDAALVCLRGQPMIEPACVASVCSTDMDCNEGFACRPVQVGTRVVHVCGAMGTATEGQWCLKLPRLQRSACLPGLICAANRCGRRCQVDGAQGCPLGFSCKNLDVDGGVCSPDCEKFPCSAGTQCVRLVKGHSVCARVQGRDCQNGEACTAPQVCTVSLGGARETPDARMQCLLPCEPQGPPCPQGEVCLVSRCRQRCTGSEDPSPCAPTEMCEVEPGASTGACVLKR